MTILTNMKNARAEWSVAEAKARFSEVVTEAMDGTPQHVTRYGRDVVVIVSHDDWLRMQGLQEAAAVFQHRPGSLLDLFEPIRSLGLDELIEGVPGELRPAGLDD